MNSDGCKEKAPIPIQLRAPPRTSPIPGTRTSINRTKLVKKKGVAYFL